MATTGTVRAGFYQRYLTGPEREIITPLPELQDHISHAIVAVKGGDVPRSRDLATKAGRLLVSEGATRLLLACTELPIALAGTDLEPYCIDATSCLAEACVIFSLGEAVK